MHWIRNSILIVLVIFFSSCFNYGVLEKQAHLSKLLSESSGIEQLNYSNDLWMINDHGNANKLYRVSTDGKIVNTITVKGVKNEDWEDLTSDGASRLFIGEFGNNKNNRKDLAVYCVNLNEIQNNEVVPEIIHFTLEDQEAFPPKKSNRNYDIEAFFYAQNHLYLFTKNRSSKFDGTTKLYKLNASPGHHVAQLIGQYTLCDDKKDCKVTSAAISPDGKEFALLTHNSVYLVSAFTTDFKKGKLRQYPLKHNSQKEAICYSTDGSKLFITDERHKGEGGNLYVWVP